jgi:predicted unusual protein kinase regulating ubiquinone biosynthesis (AarF/ABC1/UbiB family)
MVRRNMAKRYRNQVVVPQPLYATRHVLIMEYLHGEKLVKALQVRTPARR